MARGATESVLRHSLEGSIGVISGVGPVAIPVRPVIHSQPRSFAADKNGAGVGISHFDKTAILVQQRVALIVFNGGPRLHEENGALWVVPCTASDNSGSEVVTVDHALLCIIGTINGIKYLPILVIRGKEDPVDRRGRRRSLGFGHDGKAGRENGA